MDVTGRGVLFLALSSVVWRATSRPPFAPRREGVSDFQTYGGFY